MVPLQACAGRAETVNCHAHPRILLPQNRCLPEPLAAPFPHQPEPRCNTLDFASKVVCQRALLSPVGSVRCFKMRCIVRSPLATRTPLETQEKRPSTALFVLGQCADPLAHSLDQRNDKRISHGEIAQSFRHPDCPVIREAVEPLKSDGYMVSNILRRNDAESVFSPFRALRAGVYPWLAERRKSSAAFWRYERFC